MAFGLRTGDHVADLGGRYLTVILSGGLRSLCRRDGDNAIDYYYNHDLVKLTVCPGCGHLTEPYAPCGSPECHIRPEDDHE
jgi:hypothetical protein